MLVLASPALAHRCDNCFEPRFGPPGTVVTAPRAYRVTWNQDHYYGLKDLYRARARTLSLFDATQPRRGVTIKVPKVTSGRYALSAYDGSEGGGHYAYTAFRVTAPASPLPRTGGSMPTWIAVALMTVLLGMQFLRCARGRWH